MENKIAWGPALWSILHHCTERIGTIPERFSEEFELWTICLRHLQYNLPCVKCRTHYTAYYEKNGPPVITKEGVRYWLYELHSDINTRLGKPNIEYHHLEEMYSKPFDFKNMIAIIKTQLNYNIRLKLLSPIDMEKFIRELDHFRRYYQLA